jgi:hypothetical protein
MNDRRVIPGMNGLMDSCAVKFKSVDIVGRFPGKLVEARLRFSDMRINEIASELGFTDESHLNKFFKSQKGLSPKAFRLARHQ